MDSVCPCSLNETRRMTKSRANTRANSKAKATPATPSLSMTDAPKQSSLPRERDSTILKAIRGVQMDIKALKTELKIEASWLIPAIRTSSGEVTVDQGEINNSFKDFYSSLYSSASVQDPCLFDAFFQDLQIPNIDQAIQDELEKDVTRRYLLQSLHLIVVRAQDQTVYGSNFIRHFLMFSLRFSHWCLWSLLRMIDYLPAFIMLQYHCCWKRIKILSIAVLTIQSPY